MKTMFLDYQSLSVAILVSTFELLQVAVVKNMIIVLVLLMEDTVLHPMLAITIIVNQLLGIRVILTHIISMTHYGTEKDV